MNIKYIIGIVTVVAIVGILATVALPGRENVQNEVVSDSIMNQIEGESLVLPECMRDMDCGYPTCNGELNVVIPACFRGKCKENFIFCADDEMCVSASCVPKPPTTTSNEIIGEEIEIIPPSIMGEIEGEATSCTSVGDCPSNFCRGDNIQKYSCVNGECTAILEPCPIGSECREVRIWDELQGYINKPKCVEIEEPELDEIIGIPLDIKIEEPNPDEITGITFDIETISSTTTSTSSTTSTIKTGGGGDSNAIFKHNWEMPPDVDYNYAALVAMNPEQIRALGSQINIQAFNYYENRNVQAQNYFIPFPRVQFTLNPADPTGVPCANEYYAANSALDINLVRPPPPTIDCGWGSPASFDGVLTVSPEHIIAWLNEYGSE